MKRENRLCYVLDVPGPTSGQLALVPHPNFRGLWIRTDACVAFVSCSHCQSPAGIPCRSHAEKGPRMWVGSTHCARREVYRRREHSAMGTPIEGRTVSHTDHSVSPPAPLVSPSSSCEPHPAAVS